MKNQVTHRAVVSQIAKHAEEANTFGGSDTRKMMDEFYAPFQGEDGKLTTNGLNEAYDVLLDAIGDGRIAMGILLASSLQHEGLPNDMSQNDTERWKDDIGEMFGTETANEVLKKGNNQ